MVLPNVLRMINRPIVPAPRTLDDFKVALVNIAFPSIILLFGDIVGLPKLLARAQQHGKQLVVHLDLLDGIGKDKAGIKFLARLGVPAVITTKSHLGSAARDAGLMVIQRVFLMDSEALRQGINTLKKFTPDALEVLPAAVPAGVVQRLIRNLSEIVEYYVKI